MMRAIDVRSYDIEARLRFRKIYIFILIPAFFLRCQIDCCSPLDLAALISSSLRFEPPRGELYTRQNEYFFRTFDAGRFF